MRYGEFDYMKFAQVMDYIEERNKLGSVPGLDNIKGLLERLGNPEKGIPAFHIAGTNGKGSIMAYVESVLIEAGYKVGRYISPTIIDYRERWQINKRYISKKDCAEILTEVIDAVGRMEEEGAGRPTSFEIETAAAFLWFKKEMCDVILIECGMGGRLDATNVFETTPIDILASISFDHMQFLGETLEEITREKLGIVKKGDILVSYPQSEIPERIIDEFAGKNSDGMSRDGDNGSDQKDDYGYECSDQEDGCDSKKSYGGYYKADVPELSDIKESLDKTNFKYKGEKYTIHLAGGAQVLNAITAIETIDAFNSISDKYGFEQIPHKTVKTGLRKTRWQARFTVLNKEPLFIVDGAHNEDAWNKLSADVRKYFTNRKLIYIIGVLGDKEYPKMLDKLTPDMYRAFTVTTSSPRALDGNVLAGLIRERGVGAVFAESVEKAVEDAFGLAEETTDSVIIACGTLSFAGDVIRAVKSLI